MVNSGVANQCGPYFKGDIMVPLNICMKGMSKLVLLFYFVCTQNHEKNFYNQMQIIEILSAEEAVKHILVVLQSMTIVLASSAQETGENLHKMEAIYHN